MESPTSACSMPDVKATTCDHLLTGPPAGCGIDLERCLTELPASQFSMGSPLSDIPGCDAVAYSGLRDSPQQCPVMTTCPSKALLTDLGLRYCSTSSMYPLKQSGVQPPPAEGSPRRVCVNVASSRLYHSMENLHWAAVPNPGLYAFGAPYRSVDSEFIFRCTTTSHWYNGASEAFYPCQMPARPELPLFPQWLFPGVDERMLNLNTRRGVKEKLRLQSARVAEPHRPLRAQPTPGAWLPSQELCDRGSALLSGTDVAPPPQRFSSLAEIKQEVMKRLQLRRQRSTPNLSLPSEQPGAVAMSRTAESLVPQGGAPEPTSERRRPPVGRLHIPTFEEFKRMRQKERVQAGVAQSQASSGTGLTAVEASVDHGGQVAPQGVGTGVAGRASPESRQRDGAVGLSLYNRDCGSGGGDPDTSLGTAGGEGGNTDSMTVAICTSPTPRSSIKLLSGPPQGKVGDSAQTTDTDGSLGNSAPRWESLETSSSCCPALLLDGTELSSYGAKISKIKDGFIGSAFDLIKKSCSAEVAAEAPVRLSRDRDSADITGSQPGCQSSVVSMTMPACSTEAHSKPVGGGEPTECQYSSPGCRRSSSDAAYEPAESVRVHRECRLRPHFSDPMPADATKRKQLEMKLAAAAARLHGRDRKPEKARGHSEPHMGARSIGLGVTPGAQHRWSNLSSLSADSGVVGLNDERDEDEEPPSACPATDVDRVGKWKGPSASLRAWEAQRPCPDCGHRDSARGNSMCDRCLKLRRERKEAILEFLSTESSFREDLRIIKEEFYSPMQSAGLLTAEQLAVVFGNVQELIDVNDKFTEYLQDSIDQAFDRGDEDLLTVCIGELFLEFVNMLPAFQTYCLQQSTSVNMLNTLEKEKELLRIFLDVSQNDNIALRRMNLRSFLMAPLQRVTKYPLLLSRISKATAECHPDYARLWEAKSRVESHLEHINMKTKQEGTSWSLRSFRRDSRKNREVINIEMREVSMKTVGWARESTRFVMEGPLQLSQPADGQWVKKGSKALKFQNVQSLLMVHMQEATEEGGLTGQEPPEPVRDGVLVLIKDKSSGKFAVLREPIRLSNCVVSSDPDCDDTFELLDIPREAFVFRAADKCCTQQWFRQIKRYSHNLGPWRKRRNALPNIMINTAQNRS